MKKLKLIVVVVVLSVFCFMATVKAGSVAVIKACTGAGQWTATLLPTQGNTPGYANISIQGTWAGTVSLVRAYPEAPTVFYEVTTWTGNTEEALTDMEPGMVYKIGIDTGDYTSGTANVRLGM